jgi:hypothetical protein
MNSVSYVSSISLYIAHGLELKISREKNFKKKISERISEVELQGGLLYHCEILQYKPLIWYDTDRAL